jgi:YVTN family beta-propeller protein
MDNGTVSVIDGVTNQVTAAIEVTADPTWLCLNPTTSRIYCVSSERNYLNVIDAVGDTLTRKIRVRGCPQYMTCSSLMNKLYVNCTDDQTVRVYDGVADTLLTEVSFGEGNVPSWLLWHPGTNRVFCVTSSAAQSDTVFVMDCQTDMIVAKMPVGNEPNAICRDPVSGLVYVSSKYAVHVLSPSGDSVVAVVPLPVGDRTYMCAVPFPNKMYAAREYWLYVIDGSSLTVTDSIAVSVGVLVCDTDKGKVYAAARPVQVFDARGDSVLLTIPVTNGLIEAIAWNPTNSRVYMTCSRYSTVYVIRDTSTAVAEPKASPTRAPALSLSCEPNPCRGATTIRFAPLASRFSPLSLRIFDAQGRAVRSFSSLLPSLSSLVWDGCDDMGHMLPSGAYFIRCDFAGQPATARVVLQR